MKQILVTMPKVLIAVTTEIKANLSKVKGMMKYIRQHGPWDVQFTGLHPATQHPADFRNWRPDGMICDGSIPLDAIPRSRRTHIVAMDGAAVGRNVVSVDSAAIARMAAEFFLQRGFRHFAYVDSIVERPWSAERRQAFAQAIRTAGFTCDVLQPHTRQSSVDWTVESLRLRKWLNSLPEKTAVMAASDSRGKAVLEQCLAVGIDVPSRLAVIGVDDDELLCESTRPTLTSILPDFEGGGYLAAARLDDMMRGRVRRCETIRYGAIRLVERQSTGFAQPDAFAARIMEMIRVNASEHISVPDIVQAMHASRRHLETRFKAATGLTIREAIEAERLARVRELLLTTNKPISCISGLCGFATDVHLKRLFHKRFGMTMREFRNGPSSRSVPEGLFEDIQ